MVKAIVFDIDDTVYDQQKPFEEAIKSTFSTISEKDFSKLYLRFRFHSDQTFLKATSGEWSLNRMRIYRITEALRDLNYLETSKESAQTFQLSYEQHLAKIHLHSEIKRTLAFLKKRKIPMGIITNGPTEHQKKKIKQLELDHWIPDSHTIISGSTEFQKPDKEIFDLAIDSLKLAPQQIVYVGDSFENDIVGASNAGWNSLWLNHRLRPKPNETIHNYFEIHTFEQLFQTIKNYF